MRRKTSGARPKKRRVSGTTSIGKTRTRRRRRRVSGIGKLDVGGVLMDVAGLVGGAIIAREASNIVLKQFPGTSPLIIGIGQIGAGVLLPRLLKSKLGQDLGNGMVAFGGQVVAVNLGVISGNMPRTSYRIMSGTNQLTAIAGTNRLTAIAGVNNRISNPRPATRNFSNSH